MTIPLPIPKLLPPKNPIAAPKGVNNYGSGWGMPRAVPVEEDPNKGTGTINYCKPDIMSVCTAGTIWSDHIRCKYAIKSKFADRCMHNVMDGHCDSLEAQKNA